MKIKTYDDMTIVEKIAHVGKVIEHLEIRVAIARAEIVHLRREVEGLRRELSRKMEGAGFVRRSYRGKYDGSGNDTDVIKT